MVGGRAAATHMIFGPAAAVEITVAESAGLMIHGFGSR